MNCQIVLKAALLVLLAVPNVAMPQSNTDMPVSADLHRSVDEPGEIDLLPKKRGRRDKPDSGDKPGRGDKRETAHPITGGYVMTHEHPTYGMAFGGNYAFAGAPGNFRNGVMEKGYTAECGGCKVLGNCDHGEVKGSFTAFSGALGSDMGDHSSHMGPVHDSNSHLRYSTEWIKEAFDPSEAEFQDTRMKIMVAYAVENEAMCEALYYANKGNGGPGGNGYPCSKGDSIESLERQLDSIKAWVKENSSWMEIAYSAADARRIVNANKLAIVLGIESEYSFGAEDRTFDPVTRLNRYYDQGVRTFYLAHKINSRLAGADIYYPKDTDAGKAIRATQAISGCFYYDDNVGPFPLVNDLGHNFCDNKCGDNYFKGNKLLGLSDSCSSKFSEISEANMLDYVKARGDGVFNGFSIYPLPPGFTGKGGSRMDSGVERNNLGLSHDGERVVREAMIKGMIVNIDHVSSIARKDINAIATGSFGGYPLNALHNNPNNMLIGAKGSLATPFPHEYDFDDSELKMIRDTGGFFGVRLGPVDALDYPNSGVTEDCSKTSTESAKILAYLLDRHLNVGYSLDFATVTQGVHSRSMAECGLKLGTDQIHKFGSQVTEGLSHFGMMKKWHKELQTIGLKDRYLKQLKNDGVEAFIAMWERSEAKSTVGEQIPRKLFENDLGKGKTCAEDSDCPNGWCDAGLDLTKNSCKPLKNDNEACAVIGGGHQCKGGHCSWSRCYTPKSVDMGGTCYVDGACKNGKCSSIDGTKGTCVCKSDADCTDGWCNAGLDLKKNSCEPLKNDNEKCDIAGGGHQCKGGHCTWSRCYTPKSVDMGGTCYVDDACKKGKCSSIDGTKGTCVCKNDADCPGGWCDAGFDLKLNSCNAKLKDGASCGKAGSVGNDHKCKSGKCSGFPNYKCK